MGHSRMEERDLKLRGYLEVKLGHNRGINYRRLARKCWRRQWVVMDLVESQESPALIARVYGSHIHEDRNLPLSTITLTDIHALHRTQSRSHQFAFSIDGNGASITLSGSSETDSYLWMKSIRDILWPISSHAVPFWIHNNSPSYAAYEVSLIDNVHSDIARLRGFYGHLVIEPQRREVLLVEARSGMDQMRWPIKLLKKWFVASKVTCKDDKNKILVIITHKNSSSGEGIFSFYSPQATSIVEALCAGSDKAKKSIKVNPLKAFFRRSSSNNNNNNNNGSSNPGSKVKRSTSVMGRSSLKDPQSHPDDEGGFCRRPRKEVPESSKKKSASESDLLSASTKEAPPTNQISNHQPNEGGQKTSEGYYRSFDDIDDIDLGVLASSNSLEAAVVLRHKQSPPGALRYSFNSSSDSGRTSDTYAETSNGSVTSSSSAAAVPNNNLASRLYSSNSNCSGDSGTQCSMSSDSSNSKALQVLKEQVSPVYPPFDTGIYGGSISIKNTLSSPPPLPPRYATVRKSLTLPHNLATPDNATYENLLKPTPQRQKKSTTRPQSLIFHGNASMGRIRSNHSMESPRTPVNRTLARLCGLDHTTSNQDNLIQEESPRLARFLGLTPHSSFSNSTPMDLESVAASETNASRHRTPRWQSNDGLLTPGSLHGSPSVTPMRLIKNPLTMAGLAGPNDLLLQGPSPSSSSLHSLTRPMLNHSTSRTPRFMPRSATLDSLEASWRFPSEPPPSSKDSMIYMTMKRGRNRQSSSTADSEYLDMRRLHPSSQTTLAMVHATAETAVLERGEEAYEVARPFNAGFGSLTVLVPEESTLEEGEEII